MVSLVVLLHMQAAAQYNIVDGTATRWSTKYLAKVSAGDFTRDAGFTGEGTLSSPYLIQDVWDLCRLEDQVNHTIADYGGKYFRLEADIDLTEGIWTPIAVDESHIFFGYLDGNGHTIKGMRMTIGSAASASDKYYYGLFGYMRGIVRSLKLTDASITISQESANPGTFTCTGLMCGYLGYEQAVDAYGIVFDCEVQGSINGTVLNNSSNYTAGYVGGLVGYAQNPCGIYHSHAAVTLDVRNIRDVGGLIGHINPYPKSLLSNIGDVNHWTHPVESSVYDCTTNVTINTTFNTMSTLTYHYTGGIVGWNEGGNLVGCASCGTVTASEGLGYVGGICGRNAGHVISCVSLNTVSCATEGYEVGGILGINKYLQDEHSFNGTVLNTVFSGHVDGTNASSAGGIVGSTDEEPCILRNNLFLGTMKPSVKYKTGIVCGQADGLSMSNCYSDVSLYDDGNDEPNIYRMHANLTSGDEAQTGFIENYTDYKPLWKVYKKGTANGIMLSNEWTYSKGFYPCLSVNLNNLVYGTDDIRDFVLYRFEYRYKFSWDEDKRYQAIYPPKRFASYAWLASVPAPLHDGLPANFVDGSFSLKACQSEADKQGNIRTAYFSIAPDQNVLTISGERAAPIQDKSGNAYLTVKSTDQISRQWYLNVSGVRNWDNVVANAFDGGNGTKGNPFIIHNARQLVRAMLSNQQDMYYQLSSDVWFNYPLLNKTNDVTTFAHPIDHEGRNDVYVWKAHLDGDSHLVHGLYAKNAHGLFESITGSASFENIGFVDCCVALPNSSSAMTAGFLANSISGETVIRNSLFQGAFDVPTSLVSAQTVINGLTHGLGAGATVEDCVVAVSSSVSNAQVPLSGALFYSCTNASNVQRVLVLNNSNAENGLANRTWTLTDCYFPQGYLPTTKSDYNVDALEVSAMTDGTLFANQECWTSVKGRFPMLRSFAATPFGKLLALPIYTNADNRLDNMNYLQEFERGNATWSSTYSDYVSVDNDIRVIQPLEANQYAYIVRELDNYRVATPIHTASEIQQGITFEDTEAQKFCLTYFDTDGNGAVSLSELKSISAETLQEKMTKDDGDDSDNDGDLIKHFPEFRYFAGVTALGKSFYDKDKLQSLRLAGGVSSLETNAFMGNSSMQSFTIPTNLTSIGAHPFYNAGLQNYEVETDHNVFSAVDGMLLNADSTQLISYPNGRKGNILLPDNITSIASNAIYKMAATDTLFIYAKDYDYETVVQLADNGIVHAVDGRQMVVYVEDATYEESDAQARESSRRSSSTSTGEGNGRLYSQYKNDAAWSNAELHRFYDITFSTTSFDGTHYWATLYVGFDTELPSHMTAYIVDAEKTVLSSPTMVLRKIGRKIPMRTPVVVMSEYSGTFHLLPSQQEKWDEFPMSENLLEGVNRNGLNVYQSDSNDGGCLTLGRNSEGKIGFFIFKGKDNKIPPFRAYLSVNKVGAEARLLSLDSEEVTGLTQPTVSGSGDDSSCEHYNLQGQRVLPQTKGIHINKGKKVIIK